jgi:hypothetical protein
MTCQSDYLVAVRVEERIGAHREREDTPPNNRFECRLNLAFGAGRQDIYRQGNSTCRLSRVLRLARSGCEARVHQKGDSRRLWCKLVQHPEPLCFERIGQNRSGLNSSA